jgi:hypothetical protein
LSYLHDTDLGCGCDATIAAVLKHSRFYCPGWVAAGLGWRLDVAGGTEAVDIEAADIEAMGKFTPVSC